MKRMLFNATQQEELRVAIVDGQKLIDIDIETTGREQHKSNIYKGVITRIEPSLEACFVNYGEDRHGFLPFKEVIRALFKDGVDVRNASIKDALQENQEIVIQVEKEERGNKGAALTTFVSLAGRYLVLMPNNPRGGGVSRRVEGEERQELRDALDKLDLPPGMSVIARTAGIGRTVEELQWDLNYLLQLWRAIDGAGKSAPGAFLIYHESSLVIRAIRDYFQPDIGEILVDTDEIYEQARQFMSHVMPDMVHRVKRYTDDVPLFSRFQIEHQIETAYSRVIPLPSGGSVVIDHTEALVSVDVNSARSTRGTDIETTAFNTNCEAAEEVARQLRLRDLGGLIVIDFIDMEVQKNKREIEVRLKEALRYDRARVQMDKISRFGLMELSRQRLRPSLSEGSHVTCPRCNGTGHIRDVESSALQVLRIIEEESMKENSATIHVQIPVDVAAFLLNEKRGEILKIENRHKVMVILIPNKHLETPHYKLERIKHDDPRLEENQVSYELAEKADTDMGYSQRQKESVKPRQEAMVKNITERLPAPIVIKPSVAAGSQGGFFSRMMAFLGLTEEEKIEPVPVRPAREHKPRNAERRPRNRNRNSRDREEGVRPAAAIEEEVKVKEPKDAKEAKEPKESTRQPQQAKQVRDGTKPERKQGERRGTAKKADASGQTGNDLNLVTEDVALMAMAAEAKEQAVVLDQDGVPVVVAVEEETRRRRRRGGRNRSRRDRDVVEGAEITEIASDVRELDGAASSSTEGSGTQNAAPFEIHINELPINRHIEERIQVADVSKPEVNVHVVENVESVPSFLGAPSAQRITDVEIKEEFKTTSSLFDEVEQPRPKAVVEPVQQVEVIVPVVEVLREATVPFPEQENLFSRVSTDATVIENPSLIKVKDPILTEEMPDPEPQKSVEDLEQVLASAGLTLAATDPEKLKRAQEEANVQEPVVRPVRRRRTVAPQVDEPLVQIGTRKD